MNTHPIRSGSATRLALILAASALLVTGCAPAATPTASPAPASATASERVTIEDAWVKAADSGMSAAFGRIVNGSDDALTILSAESSAAASLELHETVENEAGETVMREIEGGFTIPAGGTLELAPGGDHLMLMGLTEPLTAGDDVTLTLTFDDATTWEFTAPVKDYAGANENYDEGTDHDSGMDH